MVEHRPPVPGDVNVTYADVTRAQRELGYEPRTQ
jgi:nucleoside-diphosphate-sugar epimerase